MKAVIFDLDGTLIDSVPDLHAASENMLKDEGREVLDLPTIRSFVGNGIARLIELISEARDLPRDADNQARLIDAFLAHYDQALTARTVIYPGVLESLEAFAKAGLVMGVCTNKPEAQTRAILKDLDLERYFGMVIGGDTLPQRKPAAEPLIATLEGLAKVIGDGLTVADCLYVGDSEVDAETAKTAKTPFALFTEGYRKSPVESLPHLFAFSNHDDLRSFALARQTAA